MSIDPELPGRGIKETLVAACRAGIHFLYYTMSFQIGSMFAESEERNRRC